MNRFLRERAVPVVVAMALLAGSGCAKRVRFDSFPLARSGSATARIELTYDRNNTLEVKLSEVPVPAEVQANYSRYVLWVATPDRQQVVNAGQLRVDEKKKAAIKTLTPLRNFILFITAEPAGDVLTPGPDVVFQTKEIRW